MVDKSLQQNQIEKWVKKAMVFVGVLMLFYIWSTDRISLDNQMTVYTASCQSGSWSAEGCSGKVIAGAKFRFKVLKAHQEVIFWESGSKEPSTKLSGCSIQDGRNWTCPAGPESNKSIALSMSHGAPILNPAQETIPFHEISKLTWLLLILGLNLPAFML